MTTLGLHYFWRQMTPKVGGASEKLKQVWLFSRLALLLYKKKGKMVNKEYLDKFETKLTDELLRLCTTYKALDGTLLATDDIDGKWDLLAPEYIADAVKEINAYPTVSVAWAAYLGMAVAHYWDKDFEEFTAMQYSALYGEQGFDDMDENILQQVLGIALDSADAQSIEGMIRRCAESAVSIIRHEQIEPQSPTAFYVFTRAAKTMFRIGAALHLKRMGYKFEKVQNSNL